MFIRLFLLFTLVPLVELTILIKLGNIFGLWHTVALVIITGVIGAWLARDQGLKVIRELKDSLARGSSPTDPIIEGALALVSAAFLVTPGVITDLIGFTLVIPFSRKIIRDIIKKHFSAKLSEAAQAAGQANSTWYYHSSTRGASPHGKRIEKDDDDDVIDI